MDDTFLGAAWHDVRWSCRVGGRAKPAINGDGVIRTGAQEIQTESNTKQSMYRSKKVAIRHLQTD